MLLYHFLTVVALGEVSIVTSADQGNIVDTVITTTAEGLVVVELETFAFAAPPTVLGNESALILITFRHGSFDWSRDLA